MPDWVKISHPETGGTARIPGYEHVIADFVDRGWQVDDRDDGPQIFVAPRDPKPPAEPEESPPSRRRRGTTNPAVADGAPSEE